MLTNSVHLDLTCVNAKRGREFTPAKTRFHDFQGGPVFPQEQVLHRYAVRVASLHLASLFLRRLAAGAAPVWHQREGIPVKAAASAAPKGSKSLYGERRCGTAVYLSSRGSSKSSRNGQPYLAAVSIADSILDRLVHNAFHLELTANRYVRI